MSAPATFVVLAKRPEPGRVKTRLTPPFAPEEAAALAAAALTDTLDAIERISDRAPMLAFDGDPAGWLRPGWLHHPQVSGGLDRRIAAALSAVRGPAVLVGMDTPQLGIEHFAGLDLEGFDACLGLAADGGYWTLGLARPQAAAAVVHDIAMSRPDTGQRQRQRLDELGLRVQSLPELVDVDTVLSAGQVAEAAPSTRFARLFRDNMPAVQP